MLNTQQKHVQRAWLYKRNKAVQELPEESKGDADSVSKWIDLLSDLELDELLRLILPIIKLEPGKYLIGTKVQKIIMRNGKLIARVGGGFMDLNHAIAADAKVQCL